MSICLKTGMLLVGVTAVGWSAETACAQSIGFLKLPSTVAQFFGYGYGAGHHAPIVKTPGIEPERIPRYLHAPATCGPLYPAPYVPIGCYDEACREASLPYPSDAPESLPMNGRQEW